MHLNPFEAGRYDQDSIVVRNPANGKQELFNDREYAIVKFLKENEKQSLLALLMPNIGIAKKSHVEMCLSVLRRLRRLQVVDYFSITGRMPLSQTNTLEMNPSKLVIEFPSLNALAATVYGIAGRALSRLGAGPLIGLTVVLASFSFVLFPFEAVEPALAASAPSYLGLLLLAYLVSCLALGFRSLVQASLLKTFGLEAGDPYVGLWGPFVTMGAELKAISLFGFKARAQLGIVGLVAPTAFSSLFTFFAITGLMGPVSAVVAVSSCVAMSLVSACPLLPMDGADVLQATLFRDGLEEKISERLRGIFRLRGSVKREMAFAIFLLFVWLFVWLDCLQSFREFFSGRLVQDLKSSFAASIGAGAFLFLLLLMLLFPLILIVQYEFRGGKKNRRKSMLVLKERVKDSLSFEERIAALEKIPLFAYLNDQERLSLLNEMQPAFFKNGDYLVHQGEMGKEFFVLVKGAASAVYTDVNGKIIPLAGLGEGDAFGEIALIDDVPRTASIVSDGGCIVLILRKEGFDRFAESLGSPDRVKAMVRLTSFFRRHPLFSKLGALDQAQLIDSFRYQTVTAGEQIPEGDENFFVIYSGVVRVDTGGADVEATLESDDCFGYSNPLNARYIAVEGTGLLSVAKDEFYNLIWEKLLQKQELFV